MPTLNVEIPAVPERCPPDIPEPTVADLRTLIRDTTVARAAAEETLNHEGIDGLCRLLVARVIDNLDAWIACGDWPDRHQTAAELLAELVEEGEFDLANPADAQLLRKALSTGEK